jgi:diacylglycerol kinase
LVVGTWALIVSDLLVIISEISFVLVLKILSSAAMVFVCEVLNAVFKNKCDPVKGGINCHR